MIADIIIAVVAVIALACLAGFYVSWRATRLDRLHARIETAHAALDAALLRRCAAAKELATSGLLDPAAALVLANAEQEARLAASREAREAAETSLSVALEAVCSGLEPDGAPAPGGIARLDAREAILLELQDAAGRVSIARHFHNDTVAATLAARQRPLARAFHLAGTAPAPIAFQMEEFIVPGAL